jgi:hypothetical protein
MYDRDNSENSDCGPLAYEYLYCKALEDEICKSFRTLISLHTQKPNYKTKYQPIFESIIRTCLSGEYDYWNILTYHSRVNENDSDNDTISYVKEFASEENQKLVKKLFTEIQNEEFPDTKKKYSVDAVILKGVYSDSDLNKQQIIDDFDQKVPGRIYILSSCEMLNEGIDTKWANMGVPINPTKSIVKESQRIGRLVRIPEKDMPPAIILIPCEVDITKYSSIDTPEKRDQMIREELSECGNFNTALNVISAFKYQYDSELFEMCLRYPNMYAPKEVKDNLAKQGLIVEESQGNLLDNLKYVCDKEDIELVIESFEGDNKNDILTEVAELSEKTIEIHTQNHDEPINYINEGANDEEPLRLFYCEDDETYSPIVKKDKKQSIKRKCTEPPKKRPKLFDVHTHPDLEVIWKIKEDSIDLNKAFSQGVLDVDINWNEKRWHKSLENVKSHIDTTGERPTHGNNNTQLAFLASWIGIQRKTDKKGTMLIKYQSAWKEFINDPKYAGAMLDYADRWHENMENAKSYIVKNGKRPSGSDKDPNIQKLGTWLTQNGVNYKQGILLPKYRKPWEDFINDPKYSDAMLDYADRWHENMENAKSYIVKNGKRPPNLDTDKTIRGNAKWLGHQYTNYKKGNMLPEYRKHWEDFINDPKYANAMLDFDKKWDIDLNKFKHFIRDTGKRPSSKSKTPEERVIGQWGEDQQKKYTTGKLNDEKKQKWEDFINDPKYSDAMGGKLEQFRHGLVKLKEYITIHKTTPPSTNHGAAKTENSKTGQWFHRHRKNYNNGTMPNDCVPIWEEFINDPLYPNLMVGRSEIWMNKFNNCSIYLKKHGRPSSKSKDTDSKKNGQWLEDQFKKIKRGKMDILKQILFENKIIEYKHYFNPQYENIMARRSSIIIIQKWWRIINKKPKIVKKSVNVPAKKPTKKDMSKPIIIPKKSSQEIKAQRQQRVKSEISAYHQKYKTMTSQNLNTHFKKNPEEWINYHNISKGNEESFPEDEIPRNKMINYLENMRGKKQKVVADLGCGFAEVNQHFKDNTRFTFHNFDHHSSNELVEERDIKDTGLGDYDIDVAILSLAMWGSNCEEYLKEAYRILDTGGTLLISEPYKRWNKKTDEKEEPENKLVKLLEEKGFTIKHIKEGKFMFIECMKTT